MIHQAKLQLNAIMTMLNSPTNLLRHAKAVLLAGSSLLAVSLASAANVTWDITPGTIGTGNGTVTGGDGTWDTTNGNWTIDTGVNNIAWNNASNDVAIFGGTAGTVTLGSNVTVGGMTFNTSGYSIAAGSGPYEITLGLAASTFSIGSGTATINPKITGTGGLTKSGNGTLKLTSSSNDYSGTTTISAGILDVGNMSNLSSNSYLSIGAAQLQGYGTFSRTNSTSVSGSNWKPTATTSGFSAKGGKLIVNTSITRSSSITSNISLNSTESDSELEWSGGINLGNGPMTLNVIKGVDDNSFVTISGKITAGTSLAKRGTGLLVFTNTTNDYTSQFTIGAGTVVAGGNAPASGTGVFGAAANTVRVGGGTTLTTSASDAPTLLVDGGYTVTNAISVGAVTNTLAYNATIGGRNTSGTSTYESSITLATTATNYTFTLQAATGGTTEFKTGTWTTNNKAIAVGSSGNAGIVKLSNTLSTTNTVNVNYGTLIVNGALNGGGSAITVASGAALGGDGSVAKNVTFDQGSKFAWNKGDTFTVSGTVTDGGDPGGSIFRILLAGTETFADAFWTSNQSWTSVFSSNLTNLEDVFDSFEYANASGSIDPTAYGSFTLSGTTLSWTVIPEPSTALGGLLLTAGLLRRRRRHANV